MQKWQYLEIVCEGGRPRYVNGKEIPNWQQGPTFWEAVHHLFRKGWELVDDPLAPTSDLRMVDQQWLDHYWEELPHHFKRPKINGFATYIIPGTNILFDNSGLEKILNLFPLKFRSN